MKQLDENSRIGWITHTYGPVDPKAYFNHMGVIMKWSKKYRLMFLGVDKYQVSGAREMLCETGLSMGCTHILFVDADHIVPDHMLECLSLNMESSIVSGLVTKRKPPFEQVGFVLADGQYYPIQLPIDGKSYKVDVAAMGCTLIDAEVFHTMKRPWWLDTTGYFKDGKPFNRRSDFNFMDAAREAGFKTAVDTRVLIGHLGDTPVIYPNSVPAVSELNRQNGIRTEHDSYKHQARVYELAEEVAKDNKLESVIDLGCGHPAKLIKHLGWMKTICGVDYPEKIVKIATEANRLNGGSNSKWIGHNLNSKIGFDRKFDLVIMADVIEHIDYPDNIMETAFDLLNENGILIVSSPEARTTGGHNPFHVKEFTCEELTGVLGSNRFSILKHETYEETAEAFYTNNIFVCKKTGD